jgi:hypothetical protein
LSFFVARINKLTPSASGARTLRSFSESYR